MKHMGHAAKIGAIKAAKNASDPAAADGRRRQRIHIEGQGGHTSPRCQAQQLATCGFELLDVVDGDGRELGPDDDDSASPTV